MLGQQDIDHKNQAHPKQDLPLLYQDLAKIQAAQLQQQSGYMPQYPLNKTTNYPAQISTNSTDSAGFGQLPWPPHEPVTFAADHPDLPHFPDQQSIQQSLGPVPSHPSTSSATVGMPNGGMLLTSPMNYSGITEEWERKSKEAKMWLAYQRLGEQLAKTKTQQARRKSIGAPNAINLPPETSAKNPRHRSKSRTAKVQPISEPTAASEEQNSLPTPPHSESKPEFTCPDCAKVYKRFINLYKHRVRIHQKKTIRESEDPRDNKFFSIDMEPGIKAEDLSSET